MKKEMTEEDALRRLAALCAKGEHCACDIDQKLRRWDFGDDARDAIIAWLEERHFIDDGRYAQAFIEDKVNLDAWGPRKIEMALRQKGVAEDVFRPLLAAVTEEQWVEKLRPLVNRKWEQTDGSDVERAQKVIRFALSRGFTYDQIKKATE